MHNFAWQVWESKAKALKMTETIGDAGVNPGWEDKGHIEWELF